ncbi:hypothetical protein AJ79_01019 [Helicocarpus griseus UAMH5409]|uniref:Zn(2)-C6 fungal-type domain-containing protein n=1 Tax=Helicocarpus griseus UAMH5409 TaxID=1447875 RepID=A0A2B7YAN2_9EURO|nr:hypothetical protein AJ79_01019 [Helicocarpus griseus UAMH5409]
MFGTLIHGSQDKEQLTFVENTDPESALSRNRRDKRHISCKSCRARKVRCSGQPEGCGRCAAMSIECQYPGRESRQRKRSSGRQSIGAFNTAGTVSSSGASALDNQRKPNQGLIQEQDEYRQQEQMDQRLPGSPPENSNLEGSARTAPEDWLDINNFINPIMMMTPLANINDGINIMNEVGGSSVSGDGDSSNGT